MPARATGSRSRRPPFDEQLLHQHGPLRAASRQSCWRCSGAPSCCSTSSCSPNPKQRKWLIVFVIIGLIFTGVGLARQQNFLTAQSLDQITAFDGTLTVDGFSLFFNWLFIAISLVVSVVSYRFLEIEDEHHGEYYALILFAQCGMYFLATGTDLITLFIGLELMALCFYVLVGFLRTQKRSNEAAMKYLLLGAFSSGLLVYGFSVLYGLTGSTKLVEISDALARREPFDPMVLLAVATISVGVLFKVAAAPFHMWAPDAYEGAPTTITAFLATGSKAASFAFLMRMFLGPLASARASLGAAADHRGAAQPDGRQHRRHHADRTSSACWPTAPSRTPATCCSP